MTYQCCGLDCLSWSGNIDTCDPDIYTTRGQHGRTASTFQWSIVSGCRVLIPNLNVYILCLWEWMQFSSLHILTLFVGRYEDHMCYSVRIVNSGYSCFLQFIFQVTFHVVCYFVISSFPFYLSFVASPIKNWCCSQFTKHSVQFDIHLFILNTLENERDLIRLRVIKDCVHYFINSNTHRYVQ